MKKIILIFICFFILAVGLLAYNLYTSNKGEIIVAPVISPTPSVAQKPVDSGIGQNNSTTLIGEYVCLPHKNTDGPQTMECAFGLKTHEDIFYALDLGESGDTSQLQTGKKYEVTGQLTLVEALNSDQWQKYNMKGIISVEKIVPLE